jgi:hypothetical protein
MVTYFQVKIDAISTTIPTVMLSDFQIIFHKLYLLPYNFVNNMCKLNGYSKLKERYFKSYMLIIFRIFLK